MAIDKELRLKVEAELSLGKKPRELSEKYGIPYVTVNSWKNKLDAGKEESTISELVQVDTEDLLKTKELVNQSAPQDVANKISKTIDGVIGLQTLEPKFHSVVMNLLTKAEDMTKDENLSVKDWVAISNAIGNLYANVFNKSGVNVNVLNNNTVHNEKLQMFKGLQRD